MSRTYLNFISLQNIYYESGLLTEEQEYLYFKSLEKILSSYITINFIEFYFPLQKKEYIIQVDGNLTILTHTDLPMKDEVNLVYYIYYELLSVLLPDIKLTNHLKL